MFTAETLAAEVLKAANNDIAAALAALEDGEYLNTLFPSPKFESQEEEIEYADSDENKKNMELVDCAYEIIKEMK